MQSLVELKKAVDDAKEIFIWVSLGETRITEAGMTVAAEVGGYMLTYKAQVKKLISLTSIPQQKLTHCSFFSSDSALYIDKIEPYVQPAPHLDTVA